MTVGRITLRTESTLGGEPVSVVASILAVGLSLLAWAGQVRGILTRWELQRRGLRIGTDASVATAYGFLTIWGLMAAAVIAAAIAELA